MGLTLKKIIMMLALLTLVPAGIFADEKDSKPTIVDEITANGENSVVMPEKLLQRLYPSGDEHPVHSQNGVTEGVVKTGKNKVVGWRVQIFSSNNARSAKSEANAKARQSASRYPQYRPYVTFSSPYWKVRVGDFHSQQEASAAAASLRATFGSQVSVVRDHVYSR